MHHGLKYGVLDSVLPREIHVGLTFGRHLCNGALRMAHDSCFDRVFPCREFGEQPWALSDGVKHLMTLFIRTPDRDITQTVIEGSK